ncbi:MAG: methyltransferase family protein [Candidatus Thorarchaeota archaeon]
MLDYIMTVLTTVLFGIQHSGMSSHRIKYVIINRWGKETYSRVFTWSSLLIFLVAFLTVDYRIWLRPLFDIGSIDWRLAIVAVSLTVIGLVVAVRASSVISVSTVADMQSDRQPELVTDGIYARIRHPLYLATVLIFLSLIPLYVELHVAVFALAMSVYTVVGAYLEERKLVNVYGPAYIEYRQRAGFILPKLRCNRSSESVQAAVQ